MATIIGRNTVYNKDGIFKEQKDYTIEAEIGDEVMFVDGSYIWDCYINRMDKNGQKKEWKILSLCSANGWAPGVTGRIVKTDSVWQAHPWWINKETKIVDMPIAVICDDGEIYYCNPVNIQVIGTDNNQLICV